MLQFNGNQNQVTPNPNNCCGGFALAAIINEINPNPGFMNLPPAYPDHGINGVPNPDTANNRLGLKGYLTIQNIQDSYPVGGVQSGFITNNAIVNGTRVSLPSAIVKAAICAGIRAEQINVHYCNETLNQIFNQDLINKELATLYFLGTRITPMAPATPYTSPNADEYDIILCQQGGHWIADDREDYYDPNDGSNDNPNAGINAIFSGLYIRIA